MTAAKHELALTEKSKGCKSNLLGIHANSAEPEEIVRIPCRRNGRCCTRISNQSLQLNSITSYLPMHSELQYSIGFCNVANYIKALVLKLCQHQIPNAVEPKFTCTPSALPCTNSEFTIRWCLKNEVTQTMAHDAHARRTLILT